MPTFQLLHHLPQELLSEILSYVPRSDLSNLSLASTWTNAHATPLLWREVTLTDRSTPREHGETDHHDDTPLLRKLLILATKPEIAGHVQVVNHRCHLPPVGIFNELPRTPFSGQTMSMDPRTVELVKCAVKRMEKVHTVRVVFGHANLNDALLRCFFDMDRVKQTPVRHLWLEDCRIASGLDLHFPEHPMGLPSDLDFTGLESVRFRRLPLRPAMALDGVLPRYDFSHARGTQVGELQDGQGALYQTTVNDAWGEMGTALARQWLHGSANSDDKMQALLRCVHTLPDDVNLVTQDARTDRCSIGEMLNKAFEPSIEWDDEMYEGLERDFGGLPEGLLDVRAWDHDERVMTAWRGPVLDPGDWKGLPDHFKRHQRERLPSARVAINMLRSASSTLTSLCFDWILAMPHNLAISLSREPEKQISWLTTYADLFALRFPNLRAFQYRNAVTVDTVIPHGFFLLDHAGPMLHRADINNALPEDLVRRLDLASLEFIEAHPNLQCLAWPMEMFFPAKSRSRDIAARMQAVIDNLGRTLVDLRVDTIYSSSGESQSDEDNCVEPQDRNQRRRFISDFASKMTKVESIKVEGGIPRDERREVLRALHRCPVEKIVLIGVCSPVGNTWGEGGADLIPWSHVLDVDDIRTLEAEHKDAIHRLGHARPEPVPSAFNFEPNYGWPASPPMLHTIASYHAATVTELKFCGYKGAPVLFDPTPITSPMLAPLKHFHKLRTLIMSFCLLTNFEGAPRDHEIIGYWLDTRSPTTTSLVRVTSNEDEMGGWEKELNTKYAPRALAGQVVKQLGPLLSERVKSRCRGVHVRASMCLGDWGGIFDLDVRIGKDEAGRDVCLGFEGPREELEPERRRGKLERRRWF